MNKELYVSSTPHETKVGLVEDDQLAEVYFERENEYTLAGSIYKGRVTRVLPGMQSAFVDIGLERDAFLYVSDFLELSEEDEEEGEFGEVKITAPAPETGTVDEAASTDEGEAVEAGEATSTTEASEGRRNRRRRRGRRGGRERAERQTTAPVVEESGNESVEGEDSTPRRQLRGFEPRGLVEHGLAAADEVEDAVPQYAEEEAEPSSFTPEMTASAPIVLPGESISKYSVETPQEVALEADDVPATDHAPRRSRERRSSRRGERSGERGRRERTPRTPRESEDAAPSENYAPIVLPGESISKYREVAPLNVVAEVAASPVVKDEPKTKAKAHVKKAAAKTETAIAASAAEASAPEAAPTTPSGSEDDEPRSSASYSGVGGLPKFEQRGETPEDAASENAAPVDESGEEAPTPRRRRTWRDRVTEPAEESSEVVAEVVAEETDAPVVEEEEEVAESQVESQSADESYAGSSFVIEGGNVEHEELDEDEENGNGTQFGLAVRESDEETAMDDDEYEFSGEEFEESELVADKAVASNEEAAAQPEEPRSHFERRERRPRRGQPQPRGRSRQHQQSRAVPLISDLLKEGQEILVQIAKEPIGKKGARITSHIALPGRFLVYMPTVNHIGVSRKISSEDERQRLKRIVMSERENGHGGFIVRTAAANINEDELRADIRFLKHLWSEIRTRGEGSKSPSLIYHDLNLVERVLRDQVTADFSQIWVDNEAEYERVVRFASRFQPSLVRRVKLYTKEMPLFEQFGIQEEINKSLKAKVWLKSGGYIVINQTEALVAIDINTGKYVGKTQRLEDTIVKTNIDAVKEIVRQIRLRDLGGIIVVDFIDMDERKNRQKVMQALEEAMKADRAPSKILQFNDFGLVAITRKRVKQSLERTLGAPCPYCDATGFVKSVQTVCNEIFVELRKIRRHVEGKEVILRVHPEVAKELKTANGRWLSEMEEMMGHPVLVKSDALLHQEKFDMNY